MAFGFLKDRLFIQADYKYLQKCCNLLDFCRLLVKSGAVKGVKYHEIYVVIST